MSDNDGDSSRGDGAGPSGQPAPQITHAVITDYQFSQLMSAISSSKRRMDEKLAQFQAKVRLGQEEAAAKAVKKARYEKPYTFRRKVNEAQAHFNAFGYARYN